MQNYKKKARNEIFEGIFCLLVTQRRTFLTKKSEKSLITKGDSSHINMLIICP